ncbi:MAG: heavy metal-responsive transcriptional regulator [Ignavibacteria bacterium]|nr:MAG: heavy metal-responsive transcriptional regulator [Ignavibacteria bacterium]
MKYYKPGEISKLANINVETLRYYEKIGLLPEPKRDEKSNYRIYSNIDLKRLKFIQRSKDLGFTLKEIKELLELKVEEKSTCGDIKHLAEKKKSDVENKIKDLMKLKETLNTLINQCKNEEISVHDCPIIEVIDLEELEGENNEENKFSK